MNPHLRPRPFSTAACTWSSHTHSQGGCCALQEFNLEKLQLLEQEKAKIRKEYERREGQVEVKKKM